MSRSSPIEEENARQGADVAVGQEVATVSLASNVESGFPDFFSFLSSWDGPPTDRLEQEGLGKGIDGTVPEALLDTQIFPTTKNLETVTIGTGYQEFKETLETISSLKNNLSSTVGMEAVEVVSFKVGFEFKREESSRVTMTAQGKQIHKETVRFKTEEISSSSIRLVDLLETAAKEKGFKYSPGTDIPDEERDKICKQVVRNQNGGATHYISSVDLGAKVYAVTTEHEKKSQEQKGVDTEGGGGTGEVMAKVSVDFSKETLEMSTRSENRIKFVIDPAVELKSEHTDIKTDQEKTIAYKVTPVWQLVQDRAWRESVKKACKDYVDERTPISFDQEGSFVIKIGSLDKCHYLKVTDNQVEGTPDKKEAHRFTLEFPESKKSEEEADGGDKGNVHDTDSGFFLCYQHPGGDRLYLTADTKQGIVPQTAVPTEDQAKFFLAHPVTKHAQPVSSWQDRKPLLLLRRHKMTNWVFFSETIKTFLVLQKTTSGKSPLVLQENETLDDSHSHCQFSLEHP